MITDSLETLLHQTIASRKGPRNYEALRAEQPNDRGIIGELFVQQVLNALGYDVTQNTSKGGKLGNRQGYDLAVRKSDTNDNEQRYEVKTATQDSGDSSKDFQHGRIWKTQAYNGIILLDVAQKHIFFYALRYDDIPFDVDPPDAPYRKMVKRDNGYSWSFTPKIYEQLSQRDERRYDVVTVEDVGQIFGPIYESLAGREA